MFYFVRKKIKPLLLALAITGTLSAGVSFGATTWQLQTKNNTANGSINFRNVHQTTSGTVLYTNMTTAAPVAVKVRSNPGYIVSGVTRSGVALTFCQYTTEFSTAFQKADGSIQSLIASYGLRPLRYRVVSTIVGDAFFQPVLSCPDQFHLVPGQTYTFNVIAGLGSHLVNVVVDGVSLGPVVSVTFPSISTNHNVTVLSEPTQNEDEDMTDPQMTAFFTNMSTQAAKVTASNADMVHVIKWGCSALFGGLMAVLFGTSWKG